MDQTSGDSKPTPYIVSPAIECQAQFNPVDGRWVAYSSDESGRNEVYVRSFPDPAKSRFTISSNGGNMPRWSRDGKELYYFTADNTLMAVAVTTGAQFAVGARRAIAKIPVLRSAGTDRYGWGWDIGADGRFLVNLDARQGQGPEPITVILNWQSGLKK